MCLLWFVFVFCVFVFAVFVFVLGLCLLCGLCLLYFVFVAFVFSLGFVFKVFVFAALCSVFALCFRLAKPMPMPTPTPAPPPMPTPAPRQAPAPECQLVANEFSTRFVRGFFVCCLVFSNVAFLCLLVCNTTRRRECSPTSRILCHPKKPFSENFDSRK